jgi:UDPglucose--hexose-1-phosphate uridylyltransferase
VLLAPERADRPGASIAPAAVNDDPAACPFCPGHERETPPELYVIRDPAASDPRTWKLRVVPNKFPALLAESAFALQATELLTSAAATGFHEVVIETPEHAAPPELDPETIEHLLQAWRERIRVHVSDQRLAAALPFKNYGPLAGASLGHPHSQLVFLPFVPEVLQRELENSARHFDTDGSCLYCKILEQELTDGRRMVEISDAVVTLCPFASRVPYEMHILPRQHCSHLEALDDATLKAPALALHRALARLQRLFPRQPFNLVVHSGPLRQAPLPSFHLHLELLPKMSHQGGFEWGSGHQINIVAPEAAAARLRAAL